MINVFLKWCVRVTLTAITELFARNNLTLRDLKRLIQCNIQST